ncbi:hypothetical protein BC829DRAFT_65615 [Chytridium lagenaria]|nr:hypothetical protein BC829DRAFT_65615 [Chytridium lagenaria]
MLTDEAQENDLPKLIQWWVTERTTADILPYQNNIVENVLELLSEQEGSQVVNEENEAFVRSIYEQEIERVKFVIRSYLRTRISKIEQYCTGILKSNSLRNRLAPHEVSFAERYQALVDEHYRKSFLSKLPATLQSLDSVKEPGIVGYPDLNKPVFCRVKKNIGSFIFRTG